MLWLEKTRTMFVEIDAKLMRSGITLRSPSETEQQSSNSVAISDDAVEQLSLSAKPSFSACSEQTARQATKSHTRHTGSVTAKPRLINRDIADSIYHRLPHHTQPCSVCNNFSNNFLITL